ncbi:MAG TPA: hypothetical protein VFL86_12060, partial [Burkholderiaceae bacterium]|nr:hypothetical protein [Burkholderiaceae bacterium]
DAKVYDITRTKRKKWEEIKALLKPELSAPTSSALLRLVRPLYNRFETRFINMKMKDIIEALIIGEEKIYKTAGDEAIGAPKEYYFTATDVYRQLEEKTRTIESVQSFLMAHQISFEEGDAVQVVRSLAKETFAYHLASSDEKSLLEWAFERIWREIAGEQLEADVLARYGRSLLGLNFSQEVDAWVRNNMFQLQISESPADILEFVWPFLDASPLAEKLRKLVPESARKALVTNWVQGKSFRRILLAVEAKEGYIRWGQKRRKVTVDLVVGFCQNDLAFQSCLVLNAVAASYEAYSNSVGDTGVEHFEKLGKLLKYGLPTEACTSIYEAGFADRVLSQKLAALLPPDTFGQDAVKAQIRKNRQKLADVLSEYPDYFKSVFASLTR